LIEILEDLKRIRSPVLLHVHTEKGHGFAPALEDPVKYHALKNFISKSDRAAASESRETGSIAGSHPAEARKRPSYSQVFSAIMLEVGHRDPRLVAITAAMPGGTGLSEFARKFPDRFFDVGIAEQHGCAFASGLSQGGLRPVFAVYSTFCQRAYDQFAHDTCLQENSVIFCLDRAGFSGEDGWTHHGVLDIAFMRCVPNCVLMAPRDGEEMIRMFQFAVDMSGQALAIRYPKATVPILPASRDPVIRLGKAEVLVEGEGVVLFAYGSMVDEAYRACLKLRESGIRPTLVNARFAKPIDADQLAQLSETHDVLVTLEEHNLAGGFGSAVLETLIDEGIRFSAIHRFGIPDRFVSYGTREQLLEECGLDAESLAEQIAKRLTSPEERTRGTLSALRPKLRV
ncbi:MAG: 1-deoxy-D-xylulose-5-phosphate synthase, partial [Planctomycetes bacterium]|nr:1-deoxy-D-xylulose-5-phosphate synthase [Planctomycetota bacterium]